MRCEQASIELIALFRKTVYCAAAGDSDGCARDARNVLDADPAWFTALTVDVNEDRYLLFKLLLEVEQCEKRHPCPMWMCRTGLNTLRQGRTRTTTLAVF